MYVQVVTPIVAMKAGEDYQQYVDLLVPHKAKFKLVYGEGPISLSGSHCVDFFGYRHIGAESSDIKNKKLYVHLKCSYDV